MNIGTMDRPNVHQTSADDRLSLRVETTKYINANEIEGFDPDKWFIVNIQQTGYFRVNYEADNWRRISQQLRVDASSIHLLNRAALLDDAFTLAKTGDVSYDVALSLSEYLRNERDYIP